VKRIDVLPDDILLEIFDFYVDMSPSDGKRGIEAWQSLVHVCRGWRNLVFGSPRRLNLQLYCTPETPAKDTLGVWPALPLIVAGGVPGVALLSGTDNIIAALGRSNRVCKVFLDLASWQMEQVLAAMQVPFPELMALQLFSNGETLPVIPDSFLDRSAPHLQFFTLHGVPFPGLPKLLLSADHLVYLALTNIPHSGYIPPEAMVTLLCTLSSLEVLYLEFQSPQSRPDWETRRPPPPKRCTLPALSLIQFNGVIEYLEELVTRIDTPQLDEMDITFFNQIDFDFSRLVRFIFRTPKLRALDDAHLQFNDSTASVKLRYWTSESSVYDLLINISCREPDWQLSSIEQVCSSSLNPISTVEDLYIDHQYSQLVWKNDAIENTLWLQLLLPFTAVKNLYLSKQFAPGIAAALQELVGARITEVFPSLQNIFVERLKPWGPFQEIIGQFVTARQLSGHPVTIYVRNSLSRTMKKRNRGKKKAHLSCMRSTLASIGREADIVVCAQRRNCGRNWRAFFGFTRAWNCRQVRSFLSFGPQASPQRHEERQGPKRSRRSESTHVFE
jgi:hypothetical protein